MKFTFVQVSFVMGICLVIYEVGEIVYFGVGDDELETFFLLVFENLEN